MIFWIIVTLVTLLTSFWVLLPLYRSQNDQTVRSTYDVNIYKDQLKEIDADLLRGTLTQDEANASRTEISRRLLSAADAEKTEHATNRAPKNVSIRVGVLLIASILGTSLWMYSEMGVPGLPDFPLSARAEQRPTQEQAEEYVIAAQESASQLPDIQQADPRHLELVQQLIDVLKDRPDDLVGHRMLVDNLAQLGKYIDARKAQEKVMRILGDSAQADDFAIQAEMMILAADWYVSPEAEAALVQAMNLDANNVRARYFVGIAFLQRDEPRKTYQLWSQILQDTPKSSPIVQMINSQIGSVAEAAGVANSTLNGPSNEDIEAANQMTASERQEMIKGMVAGLSERLYSEGGTPDEWVRLIRAYVVLGEEDNAKTALLKAREDLSGTADIEKINSTAEAIGLGAE